MRKNIWFFVFVAVVMCICMSGVNLGQTVTGTINGIVVDTNGGLVVGGSVEILNVETGLKRDVTTNEDGAYSATFLPIGRYRVSVTRTGFGTVIQENINVSLNDVVHVNFTLDPSVTAEVVVTDEPPTINTTNAEVKGTLTEREIEARPTFNQGSFLTLAETFTGYQENPNAGQNNPTLSSGSSINFNGTGTRGATFQINGVNNDDASENQNRQGASLATIKQFQVLTNNFSAEFGRGYGAVVLVQTKSGTNKFFGETYVYHNNSALNAKRFFDHGPKPVNRRNQFGFIAGLPLIYNKLFGFVSADWKKESGALNYVRDVFLASERNPANWFQQSPANDMPGNRAFIQSVIDRFPAGLVPNDSRSPRTYSGQVGFDRPLEDFSGRLDWQPRSVDTVTARWQYTRQQFDNEDIIIGEATRQNNKQQNGGLTWTHVFSPTTTGEFRYGLGLRNTLVGIKAGNHTPIIRFALSPIAGSIIGNAGAFPINRYQTDQQFVYNFSTHFLNNHQFKTGTDIRKSRLDDLADNFSRGFYNLSSTCNGTIYRDPNTVSPTNPLGTPSSYYAFLNGCVSNYQKGFGPFFLENRIGEYNFYAEDNWKVRPNLTLNIGFRYEYVQAPKEVEGKIDYGYSDDTNNVQPRVGFAWSPDFDNGLLRMLFGETGHSVIRGGYGIFHGRIFQSVFSQAGATVRFNPPNALFYNQSGTTTSIFNPTNLPDPTAGFVFVPGPQTIRHAEAWVDPNLEMPYTQQWSLSYERELPFKSTIRFTYSGNRGIGLIRYNTVNLPRHDPNGVFVVHHLNNAPTVLYTLPSTVSPMDPRRVDVRGQMLRPAADPMCAGTGLGIPGTSSHIPPTALCPVSVPIGPYEYSVRLPRTNERRLEGAFTTNTSVANGAWSYYNGLQIEWKKRLSHRMSFSAAYTWSKSLDTTSEATNFGTGDSNFTGPNTRTARGLSRFHTPHRFTFFGTYQTPFFDKDRGPLGQVLGGWNMSVVWKRSQGTPFSVTNSGGFDLNFDGFAETRPALLDPSILGRSISNPATSQELLPRSAFRTAVVSDFSCCVLGRNTFYSDGVNNVDLGLYKTFTLPIENQKIIFRADMFNAFNHVQFGFPVFDIASASFGRIVGTANTYSPRVVQFSFRYVF